MIPRFRRDRRILETPSVAPDRGFFTGAAAGSRAVPGRNALRILPFARITWVPPLLGTSLLLTELVPRLSSPGSPFDEGFALTYGDQVLRGALPGRDFLSFYGPLNPMILGGLFTIGGHSLEIERMQGLVYRLAVVAGILWLLRRKPLHIIALAVAAFALLFRAEGLLASASWGAVALLVIAVVCADARRPTLAGAAAVGVVLMRVDYLIAAAGAAAPYVRAWDMQRRRRFLASVLPGLGLLAAWLALIGPGRLSRLWEQLRISEPGRRLPLPSPVAFPGNAFVFACATIVLLLVVGWRSRDERQGQSWLALGLAGLGLLPSTVQRPDGPHVVLLAAFVVPVFPAVVREVRERVRGVASIAPLLRRSLVRALVVVPVAFVPINLLLGALLPPPAATTSYEVRHDGRSFRLASRKLAAAFQAGLVRLDALSHDGQTVFVGPQDLRRTNVNDAFVYFMLPRLQPSSYFIELDPHVTSVTGSRFLEQLSRTDFLVLSSDWDHWSEPNTSRRYDSPAANAIVRRRFCLRGAFGPVELLENCRLLRDRRRPAWPLGLVSGRFSSRLLRTCASTSTRSHPSRASRAQPSRTTT